MRHFKLSKSQAAFVAGLSVGFLVWGRNKTPINYQIVLYLLSRDLVALAPNLESNKTLYSIGASLVWAVVMTLHAKRPDSLQEGLRTSMDFLYEDDDHWKRNGKRLITDFIPFVGNKSLC